MYISNIALKIHLAVHFELIIRLKGNVFLTKG